jgi:hypothetical protein
LARVLAIPGLTGLAKGRPRICADATDQEQATQIQIAPHPRCEILWFSSVVEVIWQGDRAAHIVNGRTVNTISNLQQPDTQKPSGFIPLTRGKITIEIEFAEIWFRRIEVKSLV